MPTADTPVAGPAPGAADGEAPGPGIAGAGRPGPYPEGATPPTDAPPGDWAPVPTPHGLFRLRPVALPRDLALIAGWMNDPEVAAFWELAGPPEATEAHVRAQTDGDGRSVPCLGLLDGRPMSYWEIYRADHDVLTSYYPARPYDVGIHLLLGGGTDRGRGLGTELLRAVTSLILAHRPCTTRVLAEPDVRNVRSVAAFLRAGYRKDRELELPGKRAALMIRDRAPTPPA
ncbi:GNAT family N-acetyltransferase [Streptomyces sp. AM 3-1-1]|uniref:GNAT family N-acetyltransferase n=1 Tax=Streptomyces sp. AM 3-1-1 TaxID=3028711 RepID=UPI0023B93EC6|nr:GNAT family N-acetyltransferase [Streptomyces sp. AM 3-1-1]WEH30158.1 GNAT family N-acetyltransferase [Streptomyces sp. AM 3-1-1]